jgi:chromosome segregation ATPase
VPIELAESTQALWEQALRLSQQTAEHDDNAARARLEELRRETDARARSLELREKDWEISARIRERALADAREQVTLLMKELVLHRAELRARDSSIAELEHQLEEHRQQLADVIARATAKARSGVKKKRPAGARPSSRPRTTSRPHNRKRRASSGNARPIRR